MRRFACSLSVLVAAMFATSAYAQDDKSRAQAGVHFKQGSALYDEGDYRGALTQFRLGEALYPQPVFKDHIGLCHWRLGHLEDAVREAVAAGAGWAATTEAGYAAKSAGHLAAYRRILAARDVTVTTTTTPPLPDDDLVVTAPEPPPRRGVPAIVWAGGALSVVGIAALGSWAAVEVSLGPKIEAYEAAAAANDAEAWTNTRDQIESRQTLARVLLFSGAGATAVGATLLLVGLSSRERGVAIRPAPGGAVIVWKF